MKKIDVKDIRKGDKVRYEYPEGSGSIAYEYTASSEGDFLSRKGQHYLLDRPYVLPTEDGVYVRTDMGVPYFNMNTYHLVGGLWSHPSFGLEHEATVERLTSRKAKLMRLVPENEES